MGVVVKELAPERPSFLDPAGKHHVAVILFIATEIFGAYDLHRRKNLLN